MIGRVTTSAKIKLGFFQHLKLKHFFKLIARWLDLLNVLTQLYFFLYIKRVEHYQPLHGFGIFKKDKPQRICTDRADAIYQEIKPSGPGGRILDIGCNLGYFSHYFAERDYFVDGIDFSNDNVSICKLLQRVNNNKTAFSVAEFSLDFVSQIKPFQFNYAFIFSVLHHVTHNKGLEYTQKLVAQLLDKIPVLIVELAVKHEDTRSAWRLSLPENELAYFALCENITLKKIGYYRNHLSEFLRPLYIIQKHTQQFGADVYTVHQRKFISYTDNTYNGCHYYDCGSVFIKKYYLSDRNDKTKNILNEIANYQCLPKNNYFPALLSHQQQHDSITLFFEKINGTNLHDLLLQTKTIPTLSVFTQIMTALELLFTHGLYDNDVRTWNIILDKNRVFLLDLELADKHEIENTNTALLWLISQLNCFRPCNFIYPITKKPDFDSMIIQKEFLPIIETLQKTTDFAKFLAWFNQYKSGLSFD